MDKLKKCHSLLVKTSLLIGKAAWAVDKWTWLRSDLLSPKLLSYPVRAVTCMLQVAKKKGKKVTTGYDSHKQVVEYNLVQWTD